MELLTCLIMFKGGKYGLGQELAKMYIIGSHPTGPTYQRHQMELLLLLNNQISGKNGTKLGEMEKLTGNHIMELIQAGIDMTMSLQPRAKIWQQWQFRGIDQKIIVRSISSASIKSFHGSFLSGPFDKKVTLVNKLQNEEKWTQLWLGDDKFVWKSFHNTYLSTRQDGSVTLQPLLNDWEIWRRADQKGKHLWKSFHGNYLSGTNDFKVVLQDNPQAWEEGDNLKNEAPSFDTNLNHYLSIPSGSNNPQAPGTNLKIINNCPYTIWPGLSGQNNDHTPAFGNKDSTKPAGFQLKSGEQKLISLAEGAISVRVWARIECSFQTNNAWPNIETWLLCQVGECDNNENNWDGTCYKSGGQGGNTLAQLTMTTAGHWWYDISLVDGFTIPVSMNLIGKINKPAGVSDGYSCKPISCSPNQSFDQCPPELKKKITKNKQDYILLQYQSCYKDNDLKKETPQLQAYYDDQKIRSHAECSCVIGSCAGDTADQTARNIKSETGFCCSPLDPMHQDPRIKDHICQATQKPMPLNGFGGGKRYDQIFKGVCPQAYSWQFDDSKSTFQCFGKQATMQVIFC